MSIRENVIAGDPLSPREQQVAFEVLKGHTNKEIAKTLGLTYETVKDHVQHILIKFGVDRRELIAIRLMKETLTSESLGKDFVARFDRMAAEAERMANELKRQVESMRALISAAVKNSNKKGKR